jgi:LysB family phage lysis regulatory protein
MSVAAKIAAGLLVLLAAAAGTLYVRMLRADLADSTHRLETALQGIAQRDDTIRRLADDAADKARQQEQLDRSRASIAAQLTDTLHENRRLRDENAEIRAWADTPLPADVARLHDRPAQTGADGHAATMPDGAALYVPGDGAAH